MAEQKFQNQPIVPYLAAEGATEAIEFYERALGAVVDGEVLRMPGGEVGHATLADQIERQQEPPAAPQHPHRLGHEGLGIANVVDHVSVPGEDRSEVGAPRLA